KFEATRVAAYDCLAEISKIMRVLLEKYSLSRSKELLIDSRSLIAAIKQYNYTNYSPECHSDVIEAINKLYGSFHARYICIFLSNYVMDDIAMMPPATTSSSSTEPMPAAVSSLKASNDQKSSFGDNSETIPKLMSANLVDMPEERLLAHPDGMTLALDQAKLWSRYAKDLLCYLEKRTQVEIEYHRSIIKNAQYLKTTLCDGNFHLPFQDIYSNFSGHEIDNAQTSMSNFDLLTQNFLTPLNDHRLEFDKKMKKIKETWMREKKQMNETQNNFAKSRDESNAEWTNSEKIEKKRRAIEEATIREKEAHDNYNKSILAVNSQRAHITKAQRDLILRTKDQLSMLEMKIKEVTTHYFETLTDSMTFSPAQIDKSINDTSKYEFGKSYRDYANTLPPVTTTTTNSGVGRQPGSHYGRGFKAEIDSSESDNNSPMQHVTSQPHKLTTSKTTNFPLMIECDLSSSSIENEMNAITKEFKACFESNTNSFNYENNKRKRLFGVPLMSLSTNVVPSIVRQCVEEIELNGVHMNGIYRVSGVKSKVEALCHSYETNPQSVELSNLSPNIIANVLKHFFRELPEPLMTFQLYPEFIKVAKKYASNHTVEKGDDIVGSLKKVVGRMPPVHYNTLKYLMRHLRRISHNCAVNNMPPSNLGIIFGPTLLRQKYSIFNYVTN
ncbi:Rho GTPase-activating protein 29, partial [Blomia tropicalis]